MLIYYLFSFLIPYIKIYVTRNIETLFLKQYQDFRFKCIYIMASLTVRCEV